MSRPLREVASDDSGAYAVMYAMLVVVLVGMAALVVDLSMLRQERRATRLATDAAVTAGALQLNELAGIKPRAACEEAMRFAASNVGLAVSSSPCGSIPDPFTSCPSAAMSLPLGTLGTNQYTVAITWPVPDNHALMTNPTSQGGFVQAIDPLADGDSAEPNMICTRIGTTLTRTRNSMFAGILGRGGSSVISSSVARGVARIGAPPSVAALNVLEEHNCSVMTTDGQGFIQINAVPSALGPLPGIINVESDGRPSGGTSTCPSSKPYVINPSTSTGNYIKANGLNPDGTQNPGKGFIRQWALFGSGNAAQAYRPVVPTNLDPRPTPLTGITGGTPVTDRYGTVGTSGSPIDNVVNSFQTNTAVDATGAAVPVPYVDAQSPYNTQGFTKLPNSTYPSFKCTMGGGDTAVIPAGNWYVACPPSGPNGIGLTVSGTVIFQGGKVVVEGGVETKSFGCFVVNVTTTTCPTVLNPTATGDSILYMRNGKFIKGAQSAMFMPQTFTYIRDGVISMGAGDGILSWSRPKAVECALDPDPEACKYKRLGGLVLWSEGPDEHLLGGQAALALTGVLFTPKTHFVYQGQTTQNQTQAQFWTREIEVKGQSGLIMAPDPEDAVPTPSSGVALIR